MCSSFIISHAVLSHVSLFCVLPFLCQRYTHTNSFTVHSHWHIQVQTHAGPSGIQRKSAHTEDCKHTLLCFGGLCWSRKTAMTLPRGVRTVEQRWGVKGVGVTKINDLKLSFSPECVCVRVCGLYSGDIMQRKAPSLKDGLV